MSTSAATLHQPVQRSLKFTRRGDFQKTLQERVHAYLSDNHIPERDLPAMYLKTAVVMGWWLASYLLLLLGQVSLPVSLLLCLNWAIAITAVGLNVTHDSNHGGYSNNPRINKLFSLSAELLGFSGFRWRTKHNVWHHTYTNVVGFDDDLETFGSMRLDPRTPWKPLFKYQAWYYPLVYCMIGFDFVVRDFMMAFIGRSDENHVYPKMTREDHVIFWCGKIFFFVIMIGLPLLFHPWWQVLADFAVVVMLIGLMLSVIFQLAHINSDANFPVAVGSPQHIENEWAVHQVETTADFAPCNKLLNFYIGGLNYQIEHHLMPHICHLNYPRLAPIVRATCEEFGIRYKVYPTWGEAFASHLQELRLLGQEPQSK